MPKAAWLSTACRRRSRAAFVTINTDGWAGVMSQPAWGDSYVGVLECDVLLGDVGSLKHKRAIIRPVLARLRRLDVAATEAGDPDRHRRALICVATVSG